MTQDAMTVERDPEPMEEPDRAARRAVVSLVIAGSGGAGVMTVGEMLLKAAARAGWYGLMTRSNGPQIRGGEAAALNMVKKLRVFIRATSLGGVESLAEHRYSIEGPASPIPQDLIRLSIGIESCDDLIGDLEQALL